MVIANDLQRKNVGIAAAALFGLAMIIALASFAVRLFVNRQSWPNAIVVEILCGVTGLVLLVIAANWSSVGFDLLCCGHGREPVQVAGGRRRR
jgi:hypothetical protein